MAGKQSQNGHYDLDLSTLVEPIKLRITAEYSCALPPDVEIPNLIRLQRVFNTVSEAFNSKDEIDIDAVKIAEEEMWRLVEELLARATPPPPFVIRSVLTTSAAFTLLSFLARSFSGGVAAQEQIT